MKQSTIRLLYGESDYMSIEARSTSPEGALYEAAHWLEKNPDVVPIAMSYFFDATFEDWVAQMTVSGYYKDDVNGN